MERVSADLENPVEINTRSQALSQSVSQSKTKRRKASKGTVVVQVFKDRLRLVWSYLGKRYYLYIGLPDSKVNRTVAEQKARQIELDMASSNFDPSLKKYKPQAAVRKKQISAVALFQKYTDYKAAELYPRSLEKYNATKTYLRRYFKDKSVNAISDRDAENFVEWLGQEIAPITAKERLTLIKACWAWALRKEVVTENPWKDLVSRIKVPPKQMPKPFTREEIGAIIEAFRTDRYYHHYADYVEFLFGTGCRTGEAIGLRWKHLSEDCSTVWIGETLSRGVRKATKTNRARVVTLTPKLQAMLMGRRSPGFKADDLVFISPKGHAIDDHNFRNRAWKKVLTSLDVEYRKPYTTRHTLISHALDLGKNPVEVAQLTRHDVETLYQNYAGVVSSRPRLPEL